MELFHALDHEMVIEVLPGVELMLTDTGHIFGSTAIYLKIDDGDRVLNVSYSGDVGRYSTRLLPEPVRSPKTM